MAFSVSETTAVPADYRSAAMAEWRAGWPLVLATTMGMSLTGVHLYSIGVLLDPIHQDTGWSRTEITLGQTLSSSISAVFAPICGLLMDRFGPRRVALPGIVVFCLALMAFLTIDDALMQWYALWCVLSLGLLGLKPNIWCGSVSTAFSASRALALAVTISGVSIASATVPSIANQLLLHFGWRGAYFGLGIMWLLLVFPLCVAFLRTTRDVPAAAGKQPVGAHAPGLSVRAGLVSFAFAKLALAGFLFSLALVAVALHFVPVLVDSGLGRTAAAGIAGLIGIFSIIGRLVTGMLLDRYSGSLIGGVALVLPLLPTLLLLSGPVGISGAIVIAILFGLSFGSELDILAYLATRHFGLRNYGTLFGCIIGILAAATALGPVLASMVRDSWGSYHPLLWATVPFYLAGALAIATLGPYPDFAETKT